MTGISMQRKISEKWDYKQGAAHPKSPGSSGGYARRRSGKVYLSQQVYNCLKYIIECCEGLIFCLRKLFQVNIKVNQVHKLTDPGMDIIQANLPEPLGPEFFHAERS